MNPNTNSNPKYPCNICSRNVRGNAKAVCCDICNKWVHINCNFISKAKYKELSSEDNIDNFYCITCINQEFPFGLENNTVFNQTNSLGLNTDSSLENLNFNLSKDEKKSINHIANLILENNDSVIRNKKFCNYYTTDEFCLKTFKILNIFLFFISTSILYNSTNPTLIYCLIL